MRKTVLLCLLACAPSASRAAGGVVKVPPKNPIPVDPDVLAWKAPIATLVSAVSLSNPGLIKSMGYAPLTRLVSSRANGPMPIVANPSLLAPLERTLKGHGHTPGRFARETDADTIFMLHNMVQETAQNANKSLSELLALAKKGAISPENEGAIESFLSGHEPFYLEHYPDIRVNELKQRYDKYLSIRNRKIQLHQIEVPRLLAAGKINGSTLLIQKPEGWIPTDEDPRPALPRQALAEYFLQRIERLEKSLSSPWRAREVEELIATLNRPEVARELYQVWPGKKIGKEEVEEAIAALNRPEMAQKLYIADVSFYSQKAWNVAAQKDLLGRLTALQTPGTANTAALNADPRPLFKDSSTPVPALRALAKVYANIPIAKFDIVTRLRAIAWIYQDGPNGQPGWPTLQNALQRARTRAKQLRLASGLTSLATGSLAMLTSPLADGLGLTSPLAMGAAAAVFALSTALFILALNRLTALNQISSILRPLDKDMGDYFKKP